MGLVWLTFVSFLFVMLWVGDAQADGLAVDQLAVLTIPSLSGEAVETYSLRVANTWGLGYRGIDNGMLVLVAVKEHAVRIELGKGMERYISNEEAKAIIDEVMVPEFRKGYFAAGLENGIQRLMKDGRRFVLRPTDLPASKDDR